MPLKDHVRQVFRHHFGKDPVYIALAPGRVNILGEHVDYNDGLVMPAAIDRATYIAFSPSRSKSGCSSILAIDYGEQIEISNESILNKTDTDGTPLDGWGCYPAGVAWALFDAGFPVPAMDAVFSSNVPRGAGLSSSASVEMAFAVAWQALGGWTMSPMQRALIGQRAENKYVGVNCGIMDQFASACGVSDKLLLLDCRSLDWQALPIPQNISIVIADTAVQRRLTSSGYNERRQACEDAVRILSKYLPGIKSLRDVNVEQFNRFNHFLPALVQKRSRHVVEEIERTELAIKLLERCEMTGFGEIINMCHASLRDLYEVSIPELNLMVEIAESIPGCYGARLTGAGFGGCTVNLVEKSEADTFSRNLALNYEKRTGLHPEIYICRASGGARIIE